jgi:hypothetical protein
VRSATAGALIIELHLTFDFFLQRQRFFPIGLLFQAEHECSDKGIGAVG